MAYNPYNLPRMAQPPAAAPGAGRYSLPRQAPLTQSGQLEEDQNAQGLRTGQFADVQSAAGATQRANNMRSSQALQAARGTVARAGGEMSPEAAIRAQDQAFASAGAQNLQADNQVNQLQRQYRQDALNKADTIEGRAQDANKYALSRQDQNSQFQQTFGANREDAATQKNQFGETLAQRQQEFGVTSGQTQEQINNQAGQFLQSLNQRNNEFGVTAGQNQQQINNQVDQFGQSLADSQNKFNLTRQDQNSQFGQTMTQRDKEFGVTSGQNQQQIENQANQFQQNYTAGREDAATQKDEFGQTLADSQNKFNLSRQDQNSQFAVTSGQNQQQIENQAAQAAAQMGYNYASLSQQDKEYLQTMVQRQTEFGVTSGQNQQQINNQADQFGQSLADSQNKFNLSRADQNNQFGVTSNQSQQVINAQSANTAYNKTMDQINSIQDPKARQAAYDTYMKGGDVSQFITGTLYDSNGTLNQPYRSATPGQDEYQAKIDELKSYYPNKTDAEIQQMAQTERQQDQSLSRAPADAASQQLAATAAAKNLSSLPAGTKPDQKDLDTLQSVNPQAVPMASKSAFDSWMGQNQTGGWVKLGGTAYKLGQFQNIGGGDGGDFVTLQDVNGKAQYLLHDGTISTSPPAPRPHAPDNPFAISL